MSFAECALHLVSTGGACAAAVVQAGADVPNDLACIVAAGSTANNFDECKSCIVSDLNLESCCCFTDQLFLN